MNNECKNSIKPLPKKAGKPREALTFVIIDYIVMIILCLMCIVPIMNVLAISFSNPLKSVGLIPVDIDLFAYKYILTDSKFFKAFGMTLFVAVGGTTISVLVNFMAAYPLSKRDFPFRKGIMVFFIIMMLFSGGLIPNLLWYKTIGIVNTPIIMIFPIAVQFYYITLFIAYFENLPQSVEEAAKIDGASNLKMLSLVVLPMCVPIIITISLFTIVSYWNNYQLALYYSPLNKDIHPLSLYILNVLQGSAINESPEGQRYKSTIEAALIVLSILPIVAGYPFFLKYFTASTAVGAVKE